MEIQQIQQVAVQDALRAMADYRAASGFQTVKVNTAENSSETGGELEFADGASPSGALPRVGRYINIMA